MYQPYPSSGQPAGPERPPAPVPVRTAVKLMYAGAAVSTVPLIVALAYSGDIQAYHIAGLGHRLTAAQIIQWRPLIITVVIVVGLVAPALWLWLARAAGQGRNWARILSAVLFGLATLQLAGNIRDVVVLVGRRQ
jgi:NO-binding membrane sensor protein with MHYT domain